MPQLLTRAEVAALLKINEIAVDKLRRKGVLPCVVLSPRRVRFDPEAIQRFIGERSAAPIEPVTVEG